MDGLAVALLLSVVVEKLIQLFKDLVNAVPFLPDKFRPLTVQLLSLACGLALAYSTGINTFELIGVKAIHPAMGIIITGLVIGKGSNFAHDFFQTFNQSKKGNY